MCLIYIYSSIALHCLNEWYESLWFICLSHHRWLSPVWFYSEQWRSAIQSGDLGKHVYIFIWIHVQGEITGCMTCGFSFLQGNIHLIYLKNLRNTIILGSFEWFLLKVWYCSLFWRQRIWCRPDIYYLTCPISENMIFEAELGCVSQLLPDYVKLWTFQILTMSRRKSGVNRYIGCSEREIGVGVESNCFCY